MRIKKVGETWLIEKIFMVNALRNYQNSRVYASVSKEFEISWKRLYTERQDRTSSVMISAGISKFGKTLLYFVNPGVKVNQYYYRSDILR